MPSDKSGNINFNAGRLRKNTTRMLAAKLDFDDVSDLMKFLIGREIKKYFPVEYQQIQKEEKQKESGGEDRAA